MEILSAKGVTLRRLTSLAEGSGGADPAAVAPDDGSGISFLPRESAGEVEGFPLVGVINSRTVDLSKCTIEGEGNPLVMLIAVIQNSSMKKMILLHQSDVFSLPFYKCTDFPSRAPHLRNHKMLKTFFNSC